MKPAEHTDELERAYAALEMLRLYDTAEAARLLALTESAVRKIPDFDLPRRKVGPTRGSTRYLGVDLFCYLLGLPMIDHAAHVERLKERITRTGPAPVRMPDGSRRVL